MPRSLTALFLALLCHGLFLALPYPQDSDHPPRLQGEETIRVTLSGKREKKQRQTGHTEKIEVREETVPPLPEETATRPQVAATEDRPPTPVTLVAPSRKKVKKSPTVAAPSPSVKEEQQRPPRIHHPPAPAETRAAEQGEGKTSVKARPLYDKNPKPEYPPLARRRNQQGTVVLTVLVSAGGDAERVILHRSSGYPLLDKSAMRTVKTWRFLPGKEDGRPLAMEVMVPVHFQLRD